LHPLLCGLLQLAVSCELEASKTEPDQRLNVFIRIYPRLDFLRILPRARESVTCEGASCCDSGEVWKEVRKLMPAMVAYGFTRIASGSSRKLFAPSFSPVLQRHELEDPR
jgi:hypothetical protein